MYERRFTAILGPDRTIRVPEDVPIEPGPVVVSVLPQLPEGTGPQGIAQRLARAAEELGITDLPADLAENHDHYIHGTPKGIDRQK